MLALYRILTWLLAPMLPLWHWRRVRLGKEDAARWKERYGIASLARPPGRLVWCHAASMGESLSLLPLIGLMLDEDETLSLLVTTGTRSSAEAMARQLPPRAFHQYVPYDLPPAAQGFLRHWRPDAALWVESELWPNLLAEAARRCPTALVNARMSPRSSERWTRFHGAIAELLGNFRVILAQSEEDAARLRRLGAKGVTMPGNLKLAAAALPGDGEALAALRSLLGSRPRLLAASTHPGEEAMIAGIHRRLALSVPDLLTIVVPRHAARGEAIAGEWREAGLGVARRSAGEVPDAATDLYLADTMGELGLFYRCAGIAFVGGSLVPHGGQNPLEAARLGCAVAYGPHMQNFAEICHRLERAGGAVRASSPEALALVLARLLEREDERRALAEAGRQIAEGGAEVLRRVRRALDPVLPPAGDAP